MGASLSVSEKSIYEFTVKDFKGRDVDLSIYAGKVLLVVNVASKCGFTDSNYTQLTELYARYKEKGFEILAFPCNQFMKQEPGTSEEAGEFACTRYKAEYPIFRKTKNQPIIDSLDNISLIPNNYRLLGMKLMVRVNGPDTAPVYKFLKSSKTGFLGTRIKWNFTKFLIDKEGRVINRYSPTTNPFAIEGDIKQALGEA